MRADVDNINYDIKYRMGLGGDEEEGE